MKNITQKHCDFLIIGAGPAGLSAGIELAKHNCTSLIIEQSDSVGGLSKTIEKDGFRFDLGGHRFFTTEEKVNKLWQETLGDNFIERPRKSRIFYKNTFFNYPISISDAFGKLGAFETMKIATSYLKSRALPSRNTKNLESWLCNLFGKKLYLHFFKSYTEKVWGIPCNQISSDWGKQRIKGLDLLSLVKNAMKKAGKGSIKTLIDKFYYPPLGPGQMYDKMAENITNAGSEIICNTRAIKITHENNHAVMLTAKSDNTEYQIKFKHLVSTMPLTELVKSLSPQLSESVLNANNKLSYRSFIAVNLLINKEHIIPDNWLYIHDPSYKTGRIQCYKNWSEKMVPDSSRSSLGCELFVTENDEIWNMDENDLVELARKEVHRLGIVDKSLVYSGFAVKVPKAYPVFDLEYQKNVQEIREEIDNITNIHPAGRYGMFKYNNMDHSILTGILAARNCLGENNDIWSITL